MTYQIHFINTQDLFLDMLDKISDASIYFLDTEFIREKTYRPQIALIQVAINDEEAFLIDPTVEDLDLSKLFLLLRQANKKIILHSARQDLEIFYYHFDFSPKNLVDTQLIAAALGYGDQIGFDSIVQALTNEIIDKSQQRTNWLERPLQQAQIKYAATDVIYLAKIFPILEAKLIEKNRQLWIKEEVAQLCNPQIFEINPKVVIKKIRHKLTSKKIITILNALTLLREEIAIKQDKIRTLICSDADLVFIAQKKPTHIQDLKKHNFTKNNFTKNYAPQIIETILQALSNFEQNNHLNIHEAPKVEKLTFPQEKLVSLISLIADIISHKQQVSRRLFATQNDINDYVRNGKSRFSQGWRYDIFGHLIRDVIKGNKGIYYRETELCII